jgi:hypothetical protein
MNYLLRFSFIVMFLSLVILWLSVRIGVSFRKRCRSLDESERDDFGIIMAAILTLLGLIIGFSFSMAITRYDQRKNLEEAEANAIGTEYVRVDFLPAADAARVRSLLRSYLDQRILFYRTRGALQLRQIDESTTQLETDLWSAVRTPAAAQRPPS